MHYRFWGLLDSCLAANVFDHALGWIHAERIINRLIPLNTVHDKTADNIHIDELKGGYIGMRRGTTSHEDVVAYKSIDQLYLDEELPKYFIHSQELRRDEVQKEADPELMQDSIDITSEDIGNVLGSQMKATGKQYTSADILPVL